MGYALIIIDMQKEFFMKNPLLSKKKLLVKSINELVRSFRKGRFPIIWIRQKIRADHEDANLRDKRRKSWITVEGTEGIELINELDYEEEDITIFKNRYSGFFNTNLEETLRRLCVDKAVFCGINTQACIRMTVIDAFQRDIEPLIAIEGVHSWDDVYHETTMRYFRESMDLLLLKNAEIIDLITPSRK